MIMAAYMEYEDSRMSIDSKVSNLSQNTNNLSTLLSSVERRISTEEKKEPTRGNIENDSHSESAPERASKYRSSTSWFDIVEQETAAKLSLQAENRKSAEDKLSPLVMDENSNSNASLRSSTSGRAIEIDILDSANIEKYEKLIRDEKIKSPFKRRLSGGGVEGECSDSHATFEESVGDGTPQHKKTKTGENDHGRERFRRESSSSSGDGSSQSSRKPVEYEKDLGILERRQKQIDYGKNTLCYENYLKLVPKDKRTKDHPKTPPKHIKYSRRAWDGVVRVWRKQLHCFDPDGTQSADD